MTGGDTRQTIMDAARATVQAHGYNGLSFRELAKQVGVKSASIHYHFPTKGDLGAALARRYTEEGGAILEDIFASSPDQASCIARYTDIFRAALLNGNRMCLCGIMAAERDELPVEVRVEVDRFIDVNVAWLTRILAMTPGGPDSAPSDSRALALFAAIEGAQLVARGRGDVAVFDRTIEAYRAAGLLP